MHESSFAGVGGTNIFTRSWTAGSQYFQDPAGPTDKTLKLYEGHFSRFAKRPGPGRCHGRYPNLVDERIPVAASASSAA